MYYEDDAAGLRVILGRWNMCTLVALVFMPH